MKMIKLKMALVIAGAFISTSVSAVPISLPANSPLYIQYTNAEQVCGSNCIGNTSGTADVWSEGNWGILRVTSIGVGVPITPNADIGAPVGANFFNNQVVNNGQITGIFYGINFTSSVTSTGGFLDLYWDDADVGSPNTNVNPASELGSGAALTVDVKRIAQDQYTGVTDGTFLVRLQFMPGIGTNIGDALSTVNSTADPTTGNGDANSYQSVVVGAMNYAGATGIWENQLNSDWFQVDPASGLALIAGSQDFFTKSSFNQNNGWDNGAVSGVEGLSSSDPTRAFTTNVPEPGTFISLGSGLLMLGLLARRRYRKA